MPVKVAREEASNLKSNWCPRPQAIIHRHLLYLRTILLYWSLEVLIVCLCLHVLPRCRDKETAGSSLLTSAGEAFLGRDFLWDLTLHSPQYTGHNPAQNICSGSVASQVVIRRHAGQIISIVIIWYPLQANPLNLTVTDSFAEYPVKWG